MSHHSSMPLLHPLHTLSLSLPPPPFPFSPLITLTPHKNFSVQGRFFHPSQTPAPPAQNCLFLRKTMTYPKRRRQRQYIRLVDTLDRGQGRVEVRSVVVMNAFLENVGRLVLVELVRRQVGAGFFRAGWRWNKGWEEDGGSRLVMKVRPGISIHSRRT